MDTASEENLVSKRLECGGGECFDREAHALNLVVAAELHAINPLHGHHTAPRQLVVHLWHIHVRHCSNQVALQSQPEYKRHKWAGKTCVCLCNVRMCVCACVCVCVRVCACVRASLSFTHTCAHTRTQTYTHSFFLSFCAKGHAATDPCSLRELGL